MWLDASAAFGLSFASAYAYWYGVHLKDLEKQELYYFRIEQARKSAQ